MDYVLGFCFDSEKQNVMLIKKSHPDWQRNLYNGIGGKIEESEGHFSAMVREFKEEAGVDTEKHDWRLFNILTGSDFRVYCFVCYNNNIFDSVTSMTDEEICPFNVYRLSLYESTFISNLTWLIGMAVDVDCPRIMGEVIYDSVKPGVKQ